MRAHASRRPTAALLIVALVLAVTLQQVTVAAADARTDDTAKPTIFLHGYDGSRCEADWGFLLDNMRAKGWTGMFHVLKYASTDSSCTARQGMAMGCMSCFGSHTHWFGHSGTAHTRNTSIRHLAWHLANYISVNFSAKGIAVDVVAHSMGGLLLRYALTKQGVDSFPRLLVEDVITLGTPHGGADFAVLAGTTQGAEMDSSSSLIAWLKQWGMNPQGRGGTDWSAIGSHADVLVRPDTATAMSAAHRWRYTTSPTWILHADYMKSSSETTTRRAQYPCVSSPGWCETSTHYPVQMIRAALRYGTH
jgi:triacylglycerol esterase/lipase EstA (alpha/beta hydrolase family)